MTVDPNEFFRMATLRICSSLNIEKALLNCLRYVVQFIPLTEMHLNLFQPGVGVVWNLATVDHTGSKPPFPPIPMSKEAVRKIESGYRMEEGYKIIDRADSDPVSKLLIPTNRITRQSMLVMLLMIEGRQLGALTIIAEGESRFTKTHARLISLLREPLAIAVSNALRYQEVLELKEMVDTENRELSRELRYHSGDRIVGAEYGLKGVMEMVHQVAHLNSPVIILGETGVGKEVIANTLHYSSPRKDGPFVKVNCGAIPENLLDSELFGHEKGAFTGAIAQTRGRFERAHRGTIFLDEVAELPLQAQVRLLRVLQHKEIDRVGGNQPIAVDVRIITATHRNLEMLIRNGAFREDLWYRLNIFPITIPPLRHRTADIPALVHHFVARKSKELKIHTPPSISSEGIERLQGYGWPGNIRELENFIERELIQSRDRPGGQPLRFQRFNRQDSITEIGGLLAGDQEFPSLDAAMGAYIRQALEMTKGRIHGPNGAARLLGINPNTLRSRMRKLGLPFGHRG